MFEVGELVKIKKGASKIDHPVIGYSDEMKDYEGEIHQIVGIGEFCDAKYYKLEDVAVEGVNSDGYWMWAEEWLEPAFVTKIEVTEDDFMNMF